MARCCKRTATTDLIVPLASAKKLFDAANEPKQSILNPGGDHNDDLAQAFWPAG